MAHKDAQVRINETLHFIGNNNVVPLATRIPVHAFAQAFIAAHFPPAHALLPGYIAFSDRMSLGWHLFNDPNEQRKMCRAIYLLWSAMHQADPAFNIPVQNASQIPQATAATLLEDVMRKARIMHEVPAITTGLQQALADMQANPLLFLRTNKVFVAGAGFHDPAQNDRNILNCSFLYDTWRDRYEFHVRAPRVNSRQIQVESVVAQHWTASQPGPLFNIATANFANVDAIELSGAHMMVTTQFTGCSFCMKEVAAGMYCAHISPAVPGVANSTNGPALAQRVIATGNFANAAGPGVFRVYGRNHGTAPHNNGYDIGPVNVPGGGHTYMNIVGFPGGTSYHIYSQVTRAHRITGAYLLV